MSKYFIPKSNLHDWMIHCTLKHLNFVIMHSRRLQLFSFSLFSVEGDGRRKEVGTHKAKGDIFIWYARRRHGIWMNKTAVTTWSNAVFSRVLLMEFRPWQQQEGKQQVFLGPGKLSDIETGHPTYAISPPHCADKRRQRTWTSTPGHAVRSLSTQRHEKQRQSESGHKPHQGGWILGGNI